MWKLVIEDDEGKRTVVPLSRDDYTIGRQEGNTIRLTERNVSRTHGRVKRNRSGNGAGHVFMLEDLRSYNGVFVNGLRVAHTQDLQHGDLIQIGDYRIVLQDDAAAAAEANATIPITTTDPSDAKATIPIAPAYRGQTLTERPNRLVMLVGPTPGVEYPLDRERMTVGRAEDASISVNHNSVSRLHCEVHALGDGRFEIVDKGSSNGVRVNAVELRRSIIEAGDVIELGDVRFKFVGAGQIFVPGPNESQQLTAISDREAELVHTKKGFSGYLVPVLGAGLVGAVIILAFAWIIRSRTPVETVDADIRGTGEAEQAILMEAKKTCSVEDCEQAHNAVMMIPDGSPWKESADFRGIVSTWAESLLKKARDEKDPATRRAILNRILSDPKVDGVQKKQATDLMGAGEPTPPMPTDLPSANPKDSGAVATTTQQPPPPTPTRPTPTSHTTVTNATTTATPTPQPTPAPTPKPTVNQLERAREAALRGEPAAVRQLLETKVRNGHGTAEEARLVREACKAMGDRACSEDIKSKYP